MQIRELIWKWFQLSAPKDKKATMQQQQLVADQVGLHLNTVRRMLLQGDCRLSTFEACLKSSGFEMRVIRTCDGVDIFDICDDCRSS
ncbi:hypothetical protein [Thiothrix sp.]|uniref:hypothetical protein n=1 Tax=Thiothrix sp. TaxID=1032 RepID=UPI0026258E6B|nr:hypothetical protein [Thiothrix sp.]